MGDAADAEQPAQAAETLSRATRTLSVQDGDLPLPPPPQQEQQQQQQQQQQQPGQPDGQRASSPQSPFAANGSAKQPDDASPPEHRPGANQSSPSRQPGGRPADSQSPRAVKSVMKRPTPTTERTESDAADFTRQRISTDSRVGRGSLAGSNEDRQSTDAGPQHGSDGSEQYASADSSSEADGELQGGDLPDGHNNIFSTAASEALAAMPSSAVPSWADVQPKHQQQRRRHHPRPETAEPRLFWGAAQAQGERDHFEDRYSLQPQLDLGPPVSVLATTDGSPALDGKQNSGPARPDLAAEPSTSRPRCSYAGVFDGHSAAHAADMAAKRLHVLLAGELGASQSSGRFEQEEVEAALHRTFSAMDFEILQEAARTGARCGSTACVALQIGSDLYVAHAGDSVAVLNRGGSPKLLTAKGGHKVDVPEEAARIKAKGGIVMPGGQRIISPSGRHSLNMSRALGDADYKTPRRIVSAVPDVQHLVLGQQDKAVILASDGLWDVVSKADAVSVVDTALGGGTAELKARATGDAAASLAHAAADALVGVALKRGTTDNVTAVVGLVRWR